MLIIFSIYCVMTKCHPPLAADTSFRKISGLAYDLFVLAAV